MRGSASDGRPPQTAGGTVTAFTGTHVGDTIEGATALKAELETELSPTEKLEALAWSKAGIAQAAQPAPSKAERRAEAKATRL